MARAMKDSGIEWIGQIPEEWRFTKTLNCLSMPITDGPHTTPELYDEGIAFISAEAVSCGNGRIDFAHKRGYVSKEFYEECCKKYIPEIDDIYMIKSGATTGRVSIVDTLEPIFTIWSPLAVFRCNKDIMISKYMFYMIQSEGFQKQVEFGWTYGTQQNIGMRTLEQLKVCIPPLFEQQKIAAFLDEKCASIDAVIEKTKASLEEYKKLKQAVITKAVTKGIRPNRKMKDSGIEWIGEIPFDWQKARLSDVTDRILVGLATSVTPYYRQTGTVLLRNLNIKEGNLDDTELLYLDNNFADTQIGKFIEKDDVLTVHTGSNLGLTCVVPDKYAHSLSFTTLITTPNAQRLNSKYLMYTINSGLGKAEVERLKCGDVKPNLNVGQFKYFSIMVPPIEEQKEIVDYLDDKCVIIDRIIKKQNETIDEFQALKKSFIYEYVTGKKEV